MSTSLSVVLGTAKVQFASKSYLAVRKILDYIVFCKRSCPTFSPGIILFFVVSTIAFTCCLRFSGALNFSKLVQFLFAYAITECK